MSISTTRNGAFSISDIYRMSMDRIIRYESTNKLYSMGYNSYGQLGHGDLLGRSSPTQILNEEFKDIARNTYSSFGITVSGDLYYLGGLDYHGSSGLNGGVGIYRSSPTLISGTANWSLMGDSGPYSSIALKNDGSLWTWGYGAYGQLGLGDVIPRSSPVQIPGIWKYGTLGTDTSTHNGMGLKSDGTLWAWGYNAYGPLGQSDIIYRSSPIQIGTKTYKFANICQHGAQALGDDGTWYRWGINDYGQLGQSNTIPRSSPTAVPGTWRHIAKTSDAYHYHSHGIRTDGALFSFGYNPYGNLGLNDKNPRSSPVQVPGNWAYVERSGYTYSTHGFKTDGTLWGWGYNSNADLGVGDTIYRSSPTQVGTDSDWDYNRGIGQGQHCAFAFKTDGTLWGWGYNYYGQLGLGDTISHSNPIQIPGLWAKMTNPAKRGNTAYYGQYGFKYD